MFEPIWAGDVLPVDLGYLQQHVKPIVPNLGVKIDNDFKLDKQINNVHNKAL